MKSYKYKYIKYIKKKINNQSGGKKSLDKILLDGTSSSGKTTISKIFIDNGYSHIAFDDFHKNGIIETSKSLPNDYLTEADKNKIFLHNVGKLMYNFSLKHDKVIFDDISQTLLDFDPEIFVVVIHAPLKDLVRNIIRRKMYDPRGKFVFKQYSEKYIRTDGSEDSIAVVNKTTFIKLLKKIKWEFQSEDELLEFADKIFVAMDIHNKTDNYIKLRNGIKYDLLIDSRGKTPEEIYAVIMNGYKNIR